MCHNSGKDFFTQSDADDADENSIEIYPVFAFQQSHLETLGISYGKYTNSLSLTAVRKIHTRLHSTKLLCFK